MEPRLTEYQNKAITDTLCRLVAEQSRLPVELPEFRRALIEECLTMNGKTDHAVLKNSDSVLVTKVPAEALKKLHTELLGLLDCASRHESDSSITDEILDRRAAELRHFHRLGLSIPSVPDITLPDNPDQGHGKEQQR